MHDFENITNISSIEFIQNKLIQLISNSYHKIMAKIKDLGNVYSLQKFARFS